MTVSGFSFVRNAVRFDFPIVESLHSLIPVCDEVIVAVGSSEDNTLDVVRGVSPQIRVIETVWDDTLREGGRVLAQQTDIALADCTGDWCVYLQADEVLHEQDYDALRNAIKSAHPNPAIEALIFRYHHFYGSYDYIGTGRQWYRREVRAVRNGIGAFSWGDAQGFRKRTSGGDSVKLKARQTDIRVYHYGWVKPPAVQTRKQLASNRLWHDDTWIEDNLNLSDEFDYDGALALERFTGIHPAVMQERIERSAVWTSRFDPSRTRPKPMKIRVSDWIEKRTGYRVGEYKNFVEV